MNITLPDGSVKELPKGSTGLDIAKTIGPGLVKAAVAITANGIQKDLSDPIEEDSEVSIITIESEEGLEIMRHTLTAQVLARAVKNLYPKAKLAIGPTIKDGFYYDFEFEKPISPEDLVKIEDEMQKIIASSSSITKKLHSKAETLNAFTEEPYKQSIVESSDQKDNFQIYYQDDRNFFDLCKGPHLPSLKHIGSFKLTKLAGAYWKGNSKNKMLTRIYGTAWKNEKDLKKHLNLLEEAAKRDHRKLAKEMDLFHLQEEAPGMVFWHPKGWSIYVALQNYMRTKQMAHDYQEINTPLVVDRKLWEASGHWDKYRENMFITEIDEEHANEKRVNALKPMNCPCHVQVYNQGLKSYRDLPVRFAEFGSCHRYEASGTMHGLMRVRGFTQDDGHIFCTEDQMADEITSLLDFVLSVLRQFGFEDFEFKLSTRDLEKSVGSDEIWDKATTALREALNRHGVEYSVKEGDAAFYGPKIDIDVRDAIGRKWQLSTIQCDFNLPERFGLEYIGTDNSRKRPIMLHRALFGSIERFFGVLLEHYGGAFPTWLAPVQVRVLAVASAHEEYATKVTERLVKAGYRVDQLVADEQLGKRIRASKLERIPYVLVVGDDDVANSTVGVNPRGGEVRRDVAVEDFLMQLAADVGQNINV